VVETDELSGEDELAGEIPDDPDEAMAWLERLAAQQGAPLDELFTIESEAEFDSLVGGVAEPAEVGSFAESIQEPEFAGQEIVPAAEEEPDETMAWLERLASGEDEVLEELSNLLAEEADPAVPEQPSPAAAAEFGEMAEEPLKAVDTIASQAAEVAQTGAEQPAAGDLGMNEDDALAWLEQLAARQGADLDELTSVAAVSEEVSMPDWLSAEMAAAAAQEAEAAVAAESARAAEFGEQDVPPGEQEVPFDQVLASLEEVAEEDVTELAAGIAAEVEEALTVAEQEVPESDEESAIEESVLVDDDVADSLPDWLSSTPTGQASSAEVDWLDELIATDIDSWLTAEEEITLHDPLITTGPLPELDAQGMPQRQPKSQPKVELERTPAAEGEPSPARPAAEAEPDGFAATPAAATMEGDERLAPARQALIARDYQQALVEYADLLNSDVNPRLLIADLETAVTNHSRQPLLRRLLGDAYMRNGQLQRALDTYRQALEQM
jgi:tetratricopeptide (TPR) repeat protein